MKKQEKQKQINAFFNAIVKKPEIIKGGGTKLSRGTVTTSGIPPS
ncbi:hypothetical protein [uncultured Kordia sp.]|nr:hypothetical protein [uncultured Kordia sp.]